MSLLNQLGVDAPRYCESRLAFVASAAASTSNAASAASAAAAAASAASAAQAFDLASVAALDPSCVCRFRDTEAPPALTPP